METCLGCGAAGPDRVCPACVTATPDDAPWTLTLAAPGARLLPLPPGAPTLPDPWWIAGGACLVWPLPDDWTPAHRRRLLADAAGLLAAIAGGLVGDDELGLWWTDPTAMTDQADAVAALITDHGRPSGVRTIPPST